MSKLWYALRLQAGREEKIKENLEKRIKSQGLEHLFGQMVIPTEKVQEIGKGGKRRERERKVHSGYLYMEVEVEERPDEDPRFQIANEAYYIVKETPGVGDFIGDRNKPVPMTRGDVNKILRVEEEKPETDDLEVKIDLNKGDQVKVKSGPFENFEGVVDEVFPSQGRVRVTVTIFGRATPVDLEYWQVGQVTQA